MLKPFQSTDLSSEWLISGKFFSCQNPIGLTTMFGWWIRKIDHEKWETTQPTDSQFNWLTNSLNQFFYFLVYLISKWLTLKMIKGDDCYTFASMALTLSCRPFIWPNKNNTNIIFMEAYLCNSSSLLDKNLFCTRKEKKMSTLKHN